MTMVIAPRVHDLGGFQVRRAVPSLQARSVGPFVFVDHMGPAVFAPGHGIDVRPHPHIGLATVTFLWSGTITHRDTLGSVQDITAGDVNWMTAGRGIAHSERTPLQLREGEHPLHGMQTWVALPKAHEETAPEFHHHPAASLPQARHGGALLRAIAGRGFGMESPVRVFADTLNVAIDLAPDADVLRHVRPDHGGMRAQRQRLEHRHRRAHAVSPRDVAGGRHYAALAAANDHRLVGQIRIVALLDGGVERVAVDVGDGELRQLAVADEAGGATGPATLCGDIEVAQAIAAEAAWGGSFWRGRGHGMSRSHCGSPSTWRAAATLVGSSSTDLAKAFTMASSRRTKSSTAARNCGSVAADRKVSGPNPLSAKNSPSRSGSPATKERA